MGCAGGFLLLSTMGFLSGYSGYLLGIAARKTGLSSYEAIAVRTMGEKWGKALALSSVIGVTACASVAYANLWGDTLLPILSVAFSIPLEEAMRGTEELALDSYRTVVLVACMLLIFPLCVKRQMSGVAAASLVSILAMGLMTLVIVYYFLKRMVETHQAWLVDGGKNGGDARQGLVVSFCSCGSTTTIHDSCTVIVDTVKTWTSFYTIRNR